MTAEYAQARQSLGESLVMLEHDFELCPAYLKRGRISAALNIPSLPFAPSNNFLSTVAAFCQDRRIYETTLNTFASPALKIPPLPREIERRARTEFLLDLTLPAEQWKISETHRRHIRRAQKNAVAIRRSRAESLQDHLALCQASMARREERGEDVPSVTDNLEPTSLVHSGAGELFQAVRDDLILSSMLVIRSRTGAYYHSAGTRPEGMEIGASHFLLHSVARTLQEQGIKLFNLGGAGPDMQGLRAFKSRFGTVPVETEAVRAVLCGAAHRVFVETCHALGKIGRR
ncbi:MAG: GNAT family N-acetyltransferase [Steroidobacteraceae bacterium]